MLIMEQNNCGKKTFSCDLFVRNVTLRRFAVRKKPWLLETVLKPQVRCSTIPPEPRLTLQIIIIIVLNVELNHVERIGTHKTFTSCVFGHIVPTDQG